jgi:hypothetical protein
MLLQLALEIKGTMNISAAIPLYEEDAVAVVGKKDRERY